MFSACSNWITLIGIINGALGGISFTDDLTPLIASIRVWQNTPLHFHDYCISFITYLSLVIGELVPKSIALNNAEAITVFLSPAMNLLRRIISFVWILSVSTKFILKIFGYKENDTR